MRSYVLASGLLLLSTLVLASPTAAPSAVIPSPYSMITEAPVPNDLEYTLTDAIEAYADRSSPDLLKRQVNGCGVYAVFCDAAKFYCCDIGKQCLLQSSTWRCAAANDVQLLSQYSFIKTDLQANQASIDSVLITNPTYVPTALINYLAVEGVSPIPSDGAEVSAFFASALGYLDSFTNTYSSDSATATTVAPITRSSASSSAYSYSSRSVYSGGSSSSSSSSSTGLAIGAIVGIAIAGIVILLAVLGGILACILVRRRRRRRNAQNMHAGNGMNNGPVGGPGGAPAMPMGNNTSYQPNNQFQQGPQNGVGYAPVPQYEKPGMTSSTTPVNGPYAPPPPQQQPEKDPIVSPTPSYSHTVSTAPISSVGVTNPDPHQRESIVSAPSSNGNPSTGHVSQNPVSAASTYYNPNGSAANEVHGGSMITPPLPGHNEVYGGNMPMHQGMSSSPPPMPQMPPQQLHGQGQGQMPYGYNEVQGSMHHPQNVTMRGQPSPPAVYGANEAYAGLPPQEMPHMRY